MNRDWAAPASSRAWAMGEVCVISDTLYITFLIAVQCSVKFFAERYLRDIVQLSPSFLSALGQRRAKRYDAKTNSHEERET